MLATADFETTTDIDDCRVWAYAICEIGNPNNFTYGNSIDEFMLKYCGNKYENNTYYFHNEKFDGEFIFYWLFRNGFKYVKDRKEFESKTFTTLISDKGVFYSIEICFEKKGKKINKVTFLDSMKKLNFPVKKIAKDFNLPIQKLELDYKTYREEGHILTEHEIDYIRNDVEIMARALDELFKQNMTKMTIGSDALSEYKNVIGINNFNKYFPVPPYDKDIRKSYKGGWTYLNKKYKGKIVDGGIVLDVNSLYPWVMYEKNLPYGEGLYYRGKYKKDDLYNLYIQRFTCMFELKEGHLPTLQIKNNLSFISNEYLESSRNTEGIIEEVNLCLTNVDLELFFDHYNVYNIEWLDGYKFKSSNKLFKEYIDKWIKVKIESNINKNKVMRSIAKLMLNSLYGKFALNPEVRSKYPVYDPIKDKVHYCYGEYEYRNPIYLPVGTFITSYAREKTIRSAQSVYDRFIYADTDSLHLEGYEMPKGLEIDDNNLGAWKNEFIFEKGKYLRQKCYMERGYEPNESNKNDNGYNPNETNEIKTNITCAGMPDSCKQYVTFENFEIGAKYEGKLQTTRVSGGIVLTDNYFTIKNALN